MREADSSDITSWINFQLALATIGHLCAARGLIIKTTSQA